MVKLPVFHLTPSLVLTQLNERESIMADEQPGPRGEKRRGTVVKFEDFVTEDVDTVLEDEDLSAISDTRLSDDSLSEEEDPRAQSEMLRTGGNIDTSIAQASQGVRDNMSIDERAELEAEWQDADPNFESEEEEDSSDSIKVEQGEEEVPVAASAGASTATGRDTDFGRSYCTHCRASATGTRRGVSRGCGTGGGGGLRAGGRGRSVVLDEPLVLPGLSDPDIPAFEGQPGLKSPVAGDRPIDYYRLFLTDMLIDHFITETNRYADQVLAVSRPLKQIARLKDWQKVDRTDFLKFLGLTLLTGIVNKPSIASYWSTMPLLYTPVFPQIMSRNRYQALLRFWHCNDNSKEPLRTAPDRDRLYKIRPMIKELQDRFLSVYTPGRFVAIDESLLLWKGQLVLKQSIPLKRARFGIKLFSVCEDSGYTYKFHIYTGKEDPSFQIQQHLPPSTVQLTPTEKIVLFMTDTLLDKGYHLFMDNRYSGPRLYQYMKTRKTVCCGTLRENRAPVEVRQLQVSHEEPVKSLRSGPLLFVKWQASKVVYMLTTMHKESMQQVERRGGQRVTKPTCVVDYNLKMGAVDKVDQMLQPYDATQKTTRWYKKVMTHLLQVALLNAYQVFKKHRGSTVDFLSFQYDVISDLLYTDNPAPQQDLPRCEDVARLTERHFPVTIAEAVGKRSSGRKCRVCYRQGRRKETSFLCGQCPTMPALCISPCFQVYHTNKHF